QGVFSITVTDGETRQLHAGDVALLEDIAPCRGHITVVGDQTGFYCSLDNLGLRLTGINDGVFALILAHISPVLISLASLRGVAISGWSGCRYWPRPTFTAVSQRVRQLGKVFVTL
ncbi:MAG: hypothetical protein WBV76_19335, partial [Pseudolabrys sp.]